MRFIAFLLALGLLFPVNSSATGLSQLSASRNAANRNLSASRLSRDVARNAISRGRGHQHRGKGMGAAGAPMIALGALEVARGMLGLMAAQRAERNAKKNEANAANLVEVKDTSGSSISGALPASAPLDTATLRAGELGESLAEIQEHFGITPEELAQGLAQGTDPRLIFMNAPQNSISAEEANLALKTARENETTDGGLLALESPSPAPAAAAKTETTNGSPPVAQAAPANTAAPTSAAPAKDNFLRDSLRDRLLASEDSEGELSPEIQAALNAKEAARRKALEGPDTLFKTVHAKYQQLVLSMYPKATH